MDPSIQAPDSQANEQRHEGGFNRTLRRALDIALVGVAAAGIVGSAVLYLQLKSIRSSLEAKIELQSKDLSASHTRLDEAQRASKDLQGQLSALNGRCNESDAQFKSTVDAFAKQASACEALRQKLHIVGYSS